MMKRLSGLLPALAVLVSACGDIRIPGDGKPAPEPPAQIPDGAPGPPPPSAPVVDPYGDGEVDEPAATPPSDVTLPSATEVTDETTTAPDDPAPVTDDAAAESSAGPPAETPEETPSQTSDEVLVLTPDETQGGTETPTELPQSEPPSTPPLPIKFQYYPPGQLIPGSGLGAVDDTVYAPGMIFPVKSAAAFPQSQVWRFGGGVAGGDQCDPSNFAAPWQDNFCEQRTKARGTPMCPTNKVHQGQDIRIGDVADCNQLRRAQPAERTLHEIVAAEDGIVQYIGGYYIQLKGTTSGNIYNYIHLNMAALKVGLDETVTAGQSLGYASNDFGGTPTTFHLHFEIKAPIEGVGITHVPPYMSLVEAYERREGGRGELIGTDIVAVASIAELPEGLEIIE